MVDYASWAPVPGSLDVAWNPGTPGRRADREPKIQVHYYDEHTVILRQSKCVHYEAPFMFLLFAGRAGTTVVPKDAGAVRSFFGFGDGWPERTVTFDLGGRVLEVLGSPGHHEAAITVYDPWTGVLFTGDTVYPGRLYVEDRAAFLATMDRLAAYAGTRPVSHVLGCHIEMTAQPGRDFPLGATYQPGERALQMDPGVLAAVRDAAAAVASRRGVHRFDDFIIYNEPGRGDQVKLVGRGLWHRLRPGRS